MNTITDASSFEPTVTIARSALAVTVAGVRYYFGGFAADRDREAAARRAEYEVYERLLAFDVLYHHAGFPPTVGAAPVAQLDGPWRWHLPVNRVLLSRKAPVGEADRAGLGANGLGLGATFVRAAEHAVAELLERHLVCATWDGVGDGLLALPQVELNGAVLERFISAAGLPYACAAVVRGGMLVAAGSALRTRLDDAVDHASSEAIMAAENSCGSATGLANTEAGRQLVEAQRDPAVAAAQLAQLHAGVVGSTGALDQAVWVLEQLVERIAPRPSSVIAAEIPTNSPWSLARALGGGLREKSDLSPLPGGVPHPFI